MALAAWSLAASSTERVVLVGPLETARRAIELLGDPALWEALASSGLLWVSGLTASVALGVPCGLALGRSETARAMFGPLVTASYATPMVAVIPFILSMLGFGATPKALVVFLFAVFPIVINTAEGARNTPRQLVEVAASFRSSGWATTRDVVLPSTFPFIMTGTRQAIARALVGTIAAEFFLSSTGVGQLLILMSRRFDTAGSLALTGMLALAGACVMAAGRRAERRFAAWKVEP